MTRGYSSTQGSRGRFLVKSMRRTLTKLRLLSRSSKYSSTRTRTSSSLYVILNLLDVKVLPTFVLAVPYPVDHAEPDDLCGGLSVTA
jgi:hypothetical protein